MGLIHERIERANSFESKGKSLPTYVAGYDVRGKLYNDYEVGNKRKQALRSGCNYLIQVVVAHDKFPQAVHVLEKNFADHEDAKNCILWLAEEPPTISWAHVYYTSKAQSLILLDCYCPFLPRHFESFD